MGNRLIKNPDLTRIPFVILWLATVSAFIFSIETNINSATYSDVLVLLFFANIIIGIISFILALAPIKIGLSRTHIIPYSILIGLVYFLFYTMSLTLGGHGLIASQMTTKTNNKAEGVSQTPTPAPSTVLTQPPTAIKSSYVDPDPPVHCKISDKCGGGTTPLKKSECDNSACCQIGNKWIFYKDRSKCTQDQGGQSRPNYAVPQNTQRTQGNNFYCWDNAYGYAYYTSSGDQCNINNLKSATYKICMNTQQMRSDACTSDCKSKSDEDSGICAWAYTGSNAAIEQSSEKYGECLNGPGGVSENYGKCLEVCTNQYAQDIKQCTY